MWHNAENRGRGGVPSFLRDSLKKTSTRLHFTGLGKSFEPVYSALKVQLGVGGEVCSLAAAAEEEEKKKMASKMALRFQF